MTPLADGLPAGPPAGPVLIAAVAVLLALTVRQRRRQRRRRHELADTWEQLQRDLPAFRAKGVHLARVHRVYQHARTGSKAILVWVDTGMEQDAWFQGRYVRPDAYLLLSGKIGYGPHNRNPKVFFVAPHGVVRELPGQAQAAWLSRTSG